MPNQVRCAVQIFLILALITGCQKSDMSWLAVDELVPLIKQKYLGTEEEVGQAQISTEEVGQAQISELYGTERRKNEATLDINDNTLRSENKNIDTRSLLPQSNRIIVGLLLPLTGPLAEEGKALLDAAQLALFDMAGPNFILKPKDTGGTPAGAIKAVKLLISENTSLILGPLLSDEVKSIAPLARQSGINIVAFSTDPTVAGEGVYLLGHTSRQQLIRLIKFAYDSGLRKFAILAPRTPYGYSVVNQMRLAIRIVGGTFHKFAFYAADGSDSDEVIKQFANYESRKRKLTEERAVLRTKNDELSKQALLGLDGLDTMGKVGFDTLLIADGGQRLSQIVALLPYYDIDPDKVKFVGTGLWDTPEKIRDATLIGSWYVSSPPEARTDFVKRFKRLYGYVPHHIATLGYDATALAASLARSYNALEFGKEALTNERGFLGADGIFRFSDDGLTERGLAILEILENGKTKIVDPAPDRF